MSLSSVFQTLRLALGPSLVYTAGTLNAGRYFREVLVGIPHHPDNRIIIEFLGELALNAKNYQSGMAVICGLGGYQPGETRVPVNRFIELIRKEGGFQLLSKTWPFSEKTDLIYNLKNEELPHPNTLRFHVVSPDDQVLLQAEYTISSKGLVFGPGARDIEAITDLEQNDSFETIQQICESQKITLLDYIYQAEEIIHSISREKSHERMLRTWEIMDATIKNGLNNQGTSRANQPRMGKKLIDSFKSISTDMEIPGKEAGLAGIYAAAVCEESLAHQLVITGPSCETAGVLPAVLKVMQSRFRLPESKLADCLMVAGFTGSLLRQQLKLLRMPSSQKHEFQLATAMAAAAATYLMTESSEKVRHAIIAAITLADSQPAFLPDRLAMQNLKHAQLAISAINLAMLGHENLSPSIAATFRSIFQNQV